ncbi:MAG: BTAD domain-containing putative transcriptional regulator [Acidobacteriota bacterium]
MIASEVDGPVYYERVLPRVAASTARWLVLSGWPGDGRRRFVRRWLRASESEGPGRRILIQHESELRVALGESGSTGYSYLLLSNSDLQAALEPLLDPEEGHDVESVTWPVWRLREEEAHSLCALAGVEWNGLAREAFERTEGWLRPFEVCLARLREAGEDSAEIEAWLEPFLRYRVAATDVRGGARPSPRRPLRQAADAAREWCLSESRFARAEDDDWRDWWTLDLLGAARLVHHRRGADDEAVRPPFRRVLELLALLALSPNRSCSREFVLENLWEPDDRRQALRNLHPTVSHLRRLLGPEGTHRIVLEDGVYRWQGENQLRVDVETFRHGIRAAATLEEREAAWTVYRGDLMEGYDSQWVVEERATLRESYLLLLEGLGRGYLDVGQLERAEDAFRTLLAQDPVREDIALEAMRLCRQRGRRDLVRHLYQRLRSTLDRELGMEPLPETVSAYRDLLR